jgi:ferredoxin
MDPDLFSLTDDGYGVALPPRNDSDDRAERLREIAECCPAGAITVTAE